MSRLHGPKLLNVHGTAHLCPIEEEMEQFLIERGLRYTRPDRDKDDPANLDFFLPDLQLYIEVKQFHTDRINNQIARAPEARSVIVLVGRNSVEALRALLA